jgi:TRAP-type C4-dicarboxylate transport system permease small subunit
MRIFQHNKRNRWLQVIVEILVIKVCTGFMWVMFRYVSGFCIHGKEASSSTIGRQPHSDIRITDGSGFQ